MKVELRIDPSLRRTQVVVCAPANTPEVQALVQRLSTEGAASTFTAFREGQALLLPLGDILRFFADGKGVSCQTAGGVYAPCASGCTSWRKNWRMPASSGCPTRKLSI